MKRIVAATISLSLLLFLAGFAQAASLTVNLVGKWEGTLKVARNAEYITTPMTLRINNQNGALFQATSIFPPPYGDGTPSNCNGAVYNGTIHVTDSQVVVIGNFLPTTPPQISGCCHSLKIREDETRAPETGVFFLKRTSTNPAAP